MNNLALLLIQQPGPQLDEALQLAERATRLLPSESEPADTLGRVYLKKARRDRSSTPHLQKACSAVSGKSCVPVSRGTRNNAKR